MEEVFSIYKEGKFVKKVKKSVEVKTDTRVPKLGVLLVGLGGNNGSTFTAGILANKLGTEWRSKRGI